MWDMMNEDDENRDELLLDQRRSILPLETNRPCTFLMKGVCIPTDPTRSSPVGLLSARLEAKKWSLIAFLPMKAATFTYTRFVASKIITG
jgi:hypothetical protein